MSNHLCGREKAENHKTTLSHIPLPNLFSHVSQGQQEAESSTNDDPIWDNSDANANDPDPSCLIHQVINIVLLLYCSDKEGSYLVVA